MGCTMASSERLHGFPATVYDETTGKVLRTVRIVEERPSPEGLDRIIFTDVQGRTYRTRGNGRIGVFEIYPNDEEPGGSE